MSAFEVPEAGAFGSLVAQRRHSLGLSSEAVDDASGLTARHVQKIEDASRRMRLGKTSTSESFIHALLRDGLQSREVQASLHAIVAGHRENRIPRLDTALLAIHALGGRLVIEWGEPPALTKRLMKR